MANELAGDINLFEGQVQLSTTYLNDKFSNLAIVLAASVESGEVPRNAAITQIISQDPDIFDEDEDE